VFPYGFLTHFSKTFFENEIPIFKAKQRGELRNFGFVDGIYFISVILCFLSIYVLFKHMKKENRVPLLFLSTYLFVLGVSNALLLLVGTGAILSVPYLFKLPMPLSFISTAASYYYVRMALNERRKLKRIDVLHLIPFVLVTLHYLPFYFSSLAHKKEVVALIVQSSSYVISLDYGWLFSEAQIYIGRTVQATVYLILSWICIARFSKRKDHNLLSSNAPNTFKWVRFFVLAQTLYLLGILAAYVVLSFEFSGERLDYITEQTVFSVTALFVFSMASYLLISPKVLLAIEKPIELPEVDTTVSLKEIETEILARELFRKQDLTQPELLKHFGIKANVLSTLLKKEGWNNLNSFINHLRVEVFLKEATAEALEKSSIEGVAKNCGFKSTATFYRVFNERFGASPRKYLDTLWSSEADAS
jgi:AraC-like DNA-binding protein